MKIFSQVEVNDIPGYEGIKLVKIPEDWDTNNNDYIRQTIEPYIDKGYVNLIFDLSKLRFIDSTGNLGLINAHIKAKRRVGSVKIFGANKNIIEIFKIIRLSELIPIYESYEDALLSFKR